MCTARLLAAAWANQPGHATTELAELTREVAEVEFTAPRRSSTGPSGLREQVTEDVELGRGPEVRVSEVRSAGFRPTGGAIGLRALRIFAKYGEVVSVVGMAIDAALMWQEIKRAEEARAKKMST